MIESGMVLGSLWGKYDRIRHGVRLYLGGRSDRIRNSVMLSLGEIS